MTITAGPHDTAFMPRTCAKCGASYEGTRMLCDGCRIGKCPTCGGPLVQTRGVEHVYPTILRCEPKGRDG